MSSHSIFRYNLISKLVKQISTRVYARHSAHSVVRNDQNMQLTRQLCSAAQKYFYLSINIFK